MRFLKQQQGFLIVEALLATVIISIALLAAAGMFIQSTQATARSADYTAATAIAQDYLENVKAGLLVAPFAPSYKETLNNIAYTVTLQETLSPLNNKLYQETVMVSWVEKGSNVSIQMTTYIVKGLPQFP